MAKETTTTTPTEAATAAPKKDAKLPANHPAVKLEREVGKDKLTTKKDVDNGHGYWVGNIRVLKIGKTFANDNLLFPRPNIKDLVTAKKIVGTITNKNVAKIQVTDANYQQLLGLVKASIKEAQAYLTAKADKKAKAAATKAAAKTAEVKEGPTPTPEPKTAVA